MIGSTSLPLILELSIIQIDLDIKISEICIFILADISEHFLFFLT